MTGQGIQLKGVMYPYQVRIYGGMETVFIGDHPYTDFIPWLSQEGMDKELEQLGAIGLEHLVGVIQTYNANQLFKEQLEKMKMFPIKWAPGAFESLMKTN